MSRKWNSELRLIVTAGSVQAELCGGWPSTRSIARSAWLIDPNPSASRGAAAALAIDRACALLESAGHTLKGLPVDAGVPDSMVVYDVVDGDFGGMPDRRIGEIAKASVAELMQRPLHDIVATWHLQRGGHSVVACGMLRTTIEPIQEEITKRKMKLRSMLPAFVALWNLRRNEIKSRPAILATARGNAVLMAAVDAQGIRAMESGVLPAAEWNAVRIMAEGFASALGMDAELGVSYYLDGECEVPHSANRWRAFNQTVPGGALAGAAA